jgi:hypothetical protein
LWKAGRWAFARFGEDLEAADKKPEIPAQRRFDRVDTRLIGDNYGNNRLRKENQIPQGEQGKFFRLRFPAENRKKPRNTFTLRGIPGLHALFCR